MEYLTSAVIVVSSNPSDESSSKTKISFSLPSACAKELLSTPKTSE